jgi:hypothetical protein
MRIALFFIAILIGVSTFKETLAQNKCVFDLDNNKEIIHLTPIIPEIDYANVRPAWLFRETEIYVPCHYKDKDSFERLPKIVSYEFAFIRNGKPYLNGTTKSSYFEKSTRYAILDAHKNDSLIIFNMKLSVIYDEKEVSVANYKNIIVDSITLRFAYTEKKIVTKDIRVEETLSNNKTFERLYEYYGSDLSIEGSLIQYGSSYNKKSKRYCKRFLFKMGERTSYDFIFEVNEANEFVYVFDNIQKKRLTVKQWENMMEKN